MPSVTTQLKKLFEFTPEEIFQVSAKTGFGVTEMLNAIVERIPPPRLSEEEGEGQQQQLKAVVFDLWYEKFKGIVLLVRIFDGSLSVGSQIVVSSGSPGSPPKVHTVKEVNALHPKQVPIKGSPPTLYAGQVGVVVANIHEHGDIAIGDVLRLQSTSSEGDGKLSKTSSEEKESKTKRLKSIPMVYASIYPCEKADFARLQKSLQKLLLNDNSVHMSKEAHAALGNGFR